MVVVEAVVVAAEGAGADDRYAEWVRHSLFGGGDGSFDCLTAASVEVQDLGDLVFCFGCGWDAEPGGCACGAGLEVGVGGDELEEVEGDVFGAAERGGVAEVHRG